jgi:ubiquinone/menaquinone biosynthesis C-methylase UbiE
VRYFLDRYFPSKGIIVEAGSGTSESSMRVSKFGGSRLLVAVDIVLPVLHRCHPIMDVRLGGDIFCLPFQKNSVDGIWNVGVMEHFTHDQIDQIMREFHRVLRPGARIVLLWPATDSIPQKILRMIEMFINFRRRMKGIQERFQFHPDEISKLRSMQESREILTRSGFQPLHIDYGLRSLMAFKTLIGEKNQPTT